MPVNDVHLLSTTWCKWSLQFQ